MSPTYTQLCEDVVRVSALPVPILRQFANVVRISGCFIDVIDGAEVFDVVFCTSNTDRARAILNLEQLWDARDIQNYQAEHSISLRVTLGGNSGPDLNVVCQQLRCEPTALKNMIEQSELVVDFLGFVPGFAYISGLPDQCQTIERLDTPRPRLPAGSLGIARGRLGTYALDGPGGWPIIGRVQTELFNANRVDPFLLKAGDRLDIHVELAK